MRKWFSKTISRSFKDNNVYINANNVQPRYIQDCINQQFSKQSAKHWYICSCTFLHIWGSFLVIVYFDTLKTDADLFTAFYHDDWSNFFQINWVVLCPKLDRGNRVNGRVSINIQLVCFCVFSATWQTLNHCYMAQETAFYSLDMLLSYYITITMAT